MHGYLTQGISIMLLASNLISHYRSQAIKFLMGTLITASLGFTASAQNVLLTNFGSAGLGGDDTYIFQLAINGTAANLQTLEIPAGPQIYNIQPLFIPNNTHIILDPGVVIQATSGYGNTDQMIHIEYVSNVSIIGTPGQAVLQMRKAEYGSGEYRHCMRIAGASNVVLDGIACNNSGGDGVWIGEGSSNIAVLRSTFDNNWRQGMSVTSVNGLLISNCRFTNTSGTAPSDGIDLEPNNPGDQLQNVSIQDSVVAGNAGNGVEVSVINLNFSSAPLSITISNVNSSSNAGSGFVVRNGHDDGVPAVGGSILVQNSTSINDAKYGAAALFYDATGAFTTFQNMIVMNANTSRTNYDGAAIAVARGGGATMLMGNISFSGFSIFDPNQNLQSYFTVEDYSHVGLSNIFINNFGVLSGLNNAPMGFVNEQPVNAVNIP